MEGFTEENYSYLVYFSPPAAGKNIIYCIVFSPPLGEEKQIKH